MRATRAQQAVWILNIEDITAVPDRRPETLPKQAGHAGVHRSLGAVRQAAGPLDLVDALEGPEGVGTGDATGILLGEVEEGEAGVGVGLRVDGAGGWLGAGDVAKGRAVQDLDVDGERQAPDPLVGVVGVLSDVLLDHPTCGESELMFTWNGPPSTQAKD